MNTSTVRKSPKNTSPERTILTWLRKRTHPLCWGRSDRDKSNLQRTRKSRILGFFRSLRFGIPARFLPKMTNALMMGHFAGQHILYFQANGSRKVPETVAKIDIDCHEKGSYEGACVCVEWLIDNGFPGLFWERSTNGRGVHAYFLINKRMYGDVELDVAMVNLERWLRHQQSVHRWDIEQVEVKGRPPIFSWGDDKHELFDVRMGTLAKLPVEALDRPEDLMATTCLTVSALNRLGREVPREGKVGRDNCTTYSLLLSDQTFGEIDPEDLQPFIPSSRNREWPLWVERMAQIGLVEDDTMAEVVYELAKWLLWVELYGEDDREARTIELLQGYILEKHNGFVTRLNEGKEKEVLSHVERIVEGACVMPSESKELFLRVRQKRQQRRYKRPIEIAPVLVGRPGEADPSGSPEETGGAGYNCTTYSLPLSPIPLPPHIEQRLVDYAQAHRMRRSRGEYPIVRFARQFLGVLWYNKGSARIHTDDLTGMVGNVHQQNDYKQILRGLGLIRDWMGTYRVSVASAHYRLTVEAKQAFEEAYRQQSEVLAV